MGCQVLLAYSDTSATVIVCVYYVMLVDTRRTIGRVPNSDLMESPLVCRAKVLMGGSRQRQRDLPLV